MGQVILYPDSFDKAALPRQGKGQTSRPCTEKCVVLMVVDR